jgi:hypothetical protein
MFEGDSADTCARKFPLVLMGDQAEGLTCADPGARTPIGVSGNLRPVIGQTVQKLVYHWLRIWSNASEKDQVWGNAIYSTSLHKLVWANKTSLGRN